jgi:hypothetical protein
VQEAGPERRGGGRRSLREAQTPYNRVKQGNSPPSDIETKKIHFSVAFLFLLYYINNNSYYYYFQEEIEIGWQDSETQ